MEVYKVPSGLPIDIPEYLELVDQCHTVNILDSLEFDIAPLDEKLATQVSNMCDRRLIKLQQRVRYLQG